MAEDKKTKNSKEKPRRSLIPPLEKETKPKKESINETKVAPAEGVDPFATIKFVVMTEKAIQLIENQNKLVFVVERGATKNDVKKAVENAFSTNVSNVQTMIDQLGRKKAFVRLTKEGEAGEIAIRLGII